MNSKVLFLGVTNHCASRFAEIMFNHIAGEQLLNYFSISRGIMTKHHSDPMDPRTVNALTARGVPMSNNLRAPKTLSSHDLTASEIIVLVSGPVLSHRISRNGNLEGKELIKWDFDNVGSLPPSELYPGLEAEVYLLVRRLQQHHFAYNSHISA